MPVQRRVTKNVKDIDASQNAVGPNLDDLAKSLRPGGSRIEAGRGPCIL
jgi:hypothetical protein